MSDLIEQFRAGQRRALARLLTHVENDTPVGRRAVREAFPQTGHAHVVGITGPPGAGKSTLVNALIRHYRGRDRRVAVLAIDPSSTLSGGATLGDRIRMMENYADPGVFIRSMATRGQLGGLALAMSSAVHLLDAFGFDVVLIETVGVGQDEVDIATAADTTVLLQVPGLGDSIQTIKAGVLEIADILVVNKADRPEARQLVRDLRNMLLLGPHEEGRVPPIVSTVASDGTGVDRLAAEIEAHRVYLHQGNEQAIRRQRRLLREVELLASARVHAWLRARLYDGHDSPLLRALAAHQIDPGTAAYELIKEFQAEPAAAMPSP